MIIGRLKDAAIIALAALALYLTGQLWFDEISNRNFFYLVSSIFVQNEQRIEDAPINISTPYRIVINYGNQDFDVILNGFADGGIAGLCDEVIAGALRYGDYTAAQPLDWNRILRSRSFIYEYKFSMPSSLFVMNFRQGGNTLTSRVKNFDYIVLVPNRVNSEGIRLLFIDEVGGQCFEYSLEHNALNLNWRMQDSIQQLQDSARAPGYSSSKQSGLAAFRDNAFIPELGAYGLTYNRIELSNPYMVNNELLLNSVGEKMTVFFNNPALMITSLTDNTVYTFSDESTIVKYYPNDVVEYSNYRSQGKRGSPVFITDFNAAVGFIAKDRQINNDFFLTDYTLEDGRHTFYFDFAINDIPMILSEDCKFETGLKHSVEITVENGWVTKYRKLVYNYTIANELTGQATLDYIDLISLLLDESDYDSEQVLLSDIMLCYKIDRKNLLTLNWFIRVNGRSITRSAGV